MRCNKPRMLLDVISLCGFFSVTYTQANILEFASIMVSVHAHAQGMHEHEHDFDFDFPMVTLWLLPRV